MWKTAVRFPHIPTALLRCLRRFSGLREKRWQIGMACVKVELSNQNRKAGATLFAMNKITQDMRFKQAVIEYSLKHGVTKAAIRYKTSRQNIYRWKRSTTVPFGPLLTALTGLTAIQISITGRDQARPGHAPQKSSRRSGGLLGEAAPAWLYQIHLRTLPSPAPDPWKPHQAPKPEIYPKTL